MDSYNRVLPIGSVVNVNGGTKKVMITGYAIQGAESDHIFDYVACLFPEGYMSAEELIMFDHDDIEHIYSLGYQSDYYFEFKNQLLEAVTKVKP